MNKLACAAISFAAPTLLLSLYKGIEFGCEKKSVSKGFKVACKVLGINSVTRALHGIKFWSDGSRNQSNACLVFTTLLVSSSVCTYFAITANSLFAIGAIASVLPLCSRSFWIALMHGESLKDAIEEIFATPLFANSTERG